METMKDVFEHEVQDLYSAENQLVKALPLIAQGAVNPALRQAFEKHLAETRTHVKRLEQVAQICNISLSSKTCKGMEGLLVEGNELLMNEKQNATRDIALIPAAQRVEHYEMAAYGSAVTFAGQLGLTTAQQLLQETLDEEKLADAKLTEIAESTVNESAMDGSGNGRR